MTIGKGGGGFPPSLQMNFALQTFQLKLLGSSVSGEVHGFAVREEEFLSQEQVDRAVTRLTAFIEASPEDEQMVFAALLAQAQAFSEENWPA